MSHEEVRPECASDPPADLAAKLVEHKLDLVVTASTPAVVALKRATEKIPVVFAASRDPISTGVVASLARRT